MYKNEITERYDEMGQFAYMQGYYKALGHYDKEIKVLLRELKLSAKQLDSLYSLMDRAWEKSVDSLYLGLGVDRNECVEQ